MKSCFLHIPLSISKYTIKEYSPTKDQLLESFQMAFGQNNKSVDLIIGKYILYITKDKSKAWWSAHYLLSIEDTSTKTFIHPKQDFKDTEWKKHFDHYFSQDSYAISIKDVAEIVLYFITLKNSSLFI